MTVSAAKHNRVFEAATERALELEDRLVDVLTPILNRAAGQAATRFEKLASRHQAVAGLDERRETDAWLLASLGTETARGLARSLVLTAAVDVTPRSTMVAVKPRPDEATLIADRDGEPAETLHVTLVYIGETDGPLEEIAEPLRQVAAAHAPLAGVVGGYGQFQAPDGSRAGIVLPDVPGLVELRVAVTEALAAAGIDYARNHGFEAHITIDADPEPGELDETLDRAAQTPLTFDELLVVRGNTEVVALPLVGVPPLTAAGPPPWGQPAPNEILDVDALVRQLHTKTDPVRLAVAETVIGAGLQTAGIGFDATNPFTARVLAQSGSQITNIAETTQLNAMRIIKAAYNEGLSIRDTATAIRAGMKEATQARARLIARTELAGVVNGGSLAAVRIVSAHTGDVYEKEWLTAAGAKFPRHNTYVGLNHQRRPLDHPFDVGGHDLDHPGDPSGPPEEICNCRCAISYVESKPAAGEPAPSLD
jgi:2'-5' RNA ligase